MKYIKKISSIVLALIMVLAMGTSVFAATSDADGSTITSGTSTKDGTLVVKKVVIAQNELANITIAYPAMSFTYSIVPATVSDTKVKGYKLDQTTNLYSEDTNGYVEAAVKAGPAGGLSENDISIAEGTTKLNAQGYQAITGDLTLSTDISEFTAPGIYRYTLTDTTPDANLTNVGLVRTASVDKEYFVDVYVGKNPADPHNLEVYGFVLINSNPKSIDKGDSDSMSVKSGIIGDVALDTDNKIVDGTTFTEANNDMYYTYNVELSKKVTGTMGDTDNEFPFDTTVTNATKNSQSLQYILNETDDTSVATSVNQASGDVRVTLSDGDIAKFIGLNPWAAVKYTETNNTDSEYTVTVKNGNNTSADTEVTPTGKAVITGNKAVAAKGKTVIAYENPAMQVTDYSAYTAKGAYSKAHITEYTNDLAAISPTNVVMRFAPYLFILGGAMMLLVASRRRKSDQE